MSQLYVIKYGELYHADKNAGPLTRAYLTRLLTNKVSTEKKISKASFTIVNVKVEGDWVWYGVKYTGKAVVWTEGVNINYLKYNYA